ncbi:MAG: ATP synthase F1 subunit delta [Acidobacteriota bacterium]|nr:ATP synthase F1 subunit delta [Acidobacteriota bacterium]
MSALASRYANAFLEVVTSAKLDTAAVDRQLNDFLATWDGSAELRALFSNPAVAASQKVAFLDTLNKKLGMAVPLRNLIAVLIDNDRIMSVHDVAEAYRQQMQERLGIKQAEIVTARELDAIEREALIAGVGKLAGARIEPTFKLDKSILGGTVVRIGSTVYDGSVRGRLERLREEMNAG